MSMLNDGDRKALEETFKKEMSDDVSVMYFTDSKDRCEYCGENLKLLEELSAIDSRIKLTVYDINEHQS